MADAEDAGKQQQETRGPEDGADGAAPEVDGAVEARDLVTALNEDEAHVVHDGLVRFVQAARGAKADQENSAVNEYLALSPECSEIFSWWEDVRTAQVKLQKGTEGSLTAALFDALATILFQAHPIKASVSKSQVVRKLLVRTRHLYKFFESTRDQKLLRTLLKLLVAMVINGPAVAREVYNKLPFASTSMLHLADKGGIGSAKNRTRDGKTRFGSTRHRFLQLTLAFLEHGDVTTKKRIMDPKGMALAALRRINEDPPDMVAFFLDGLKNLVLGDTAIGRKTKIAFFGQPVVLETMLLPLYETGDDAIRASVHAFLEAALVNPETSVFPSSADLVDAGALKAENAAFNKRIESQLARRNRVVASVARSLNPVSDKLQRDLVLAVLQLDDSLMQAFLATSWGRINLDPRPSIIWVRNIVFVRNLLALSPPRPNVKDAHGDASDATRADRLATAVLACALPGAQAVSRNMLSKGVQHASSLVVVHTLDLLAQLLQRVDAVQRKTLASTSQGQTTALLEAAVARKLVHRVPDVSVVLQLAITAGQTHKAWQPQEAEWVLLKVARVMHWYGKLLPQFLQGKLAVEKFLPEYAAPPSRVVLAAHVSIARMIDAVGPATLAWPKADALLRVWQLRSCCAPHFAVIDPVLENVFVALVATSSYGTGRAPYERIHARAWIKATRSLQDAAFVASIITEAINARPFPACDQVLQLGLARVDSPDASAVVHRVVTELIHTLADLSQFVPVLVEANLSQRLSTGPALLAYLKHVLGAPMDDASALSGFVAEALGSSDDAPRASARAFRAAFGHGLQRSFGAKGQRKPVPADVIPDLRALLLKIVDDAPLDDVWEIALLVSRATGAFRNVDAAAFELCMDILDACVARDAECVWECASGHAAMREVLSLPPGLQLRVAQLLDGARHAQNLLVASGGILESWVAAFEAEATDDTAACLLLCRYCFNNPRVAETARALLDRVASLHVPGEREGPLSRALILYALSFGPSDARTLLRLLQMAARQPGPDVDDALVRCCESMVRKHALSTRCSFASAALLDPDSPLLDALAILWTEPSPQRVHTLALLSGWEHVAKMALRFLEKNETVDLAVFAEFLARCPRPLMARFCSASLSKRIAAINRGDGHLYLVEAKVFAPAVKTRDIERVCEAALGDEATADARRLVANVLASREASPSQDALFDKFAGRLVDVSLREALMGSAADSNLALVHQITDAAAERAQGRVNAGLVTRMLEVPDADEALLKVALRLLKSGLAFADEAQVEALLARDDVHGNGTLELIWLTLAQRLPASACPASRFAGLLASYTGTMKAEDCVRRSLIRIFEEQQTGSLDAYAFCIGDRVSESAGLLEVACDASTAADDPVVLRSLLASHFDWIFTELDFHTSLSAAFPIFRSMSPQSELPYCASLLLLDLQAAHEDLTKRVSGVSRKTKAKMPNPRAPKRAKHEESYNELLSGGESDSDSEGSDDGSGSEIGADHASESGASEPDADEAERRDACIAELREELTALAEKETHSEAVDPSFALRMLERFFAIHALLAELPSTSDADDSVKEDNKDSEVSGVDNEGARQTQAESTVTFPTRRVFDAGILSYCVWAMSSFSEDVRRSAAGCLQRFGQLAMRDPLFKDSTQCVLVLRYLRNALTSGFKTRVSSIHCSYLCHVLEIVTKASHNMYQLTYRYLLRAPSMDLSYVPMFYQTFSSGTSTFRVERGWMVRVLEQGIRTRFDVDVLVNRHVLGLFMSFAGSPVADVYMNSHVLEVLIKVARAGSYGTREIIRAGGLGWATRMLARGAERSLFSGSALVDLCELLWHAAKVAQPVAGKGLSADPSEKGLQLRSDADVEAMGVASWLVDVLPRLEGSLGSRVGDALRFVVNALILWSGVPGGLPAAVAEEDVGNALPSHLQQTGALELSSESLARFLSAFEDHIAQDTTLVVGIFLIVLRNSLHEDDASDEVALEGSDSTSTLLRWMFDRLLEDSTRATAQEQFLLSCCAVGFASWLRSRHAWRVAAGEPLEARFHALLMAEFDICSASGAFTVLATRAKMLEARSMLLADAKDEDSEDVAMSEA